MEKPKAIYIVFSPEGDTPPRIFHESHADAERVAWEMARRHPDKTFYVAKVRHGKAIRWADHTEATERTGAAR